MQIYLITDNFNKPYVGSTPRSLKTRLIEHRCHNKSFKKDLNYKIELLEVCEPEKRYERENFYIKKYNSINIGYNKCFASVGAIGLKTSAEIVNKRLRARAKNRPHFKIYDKRNPSKWIVTNSYDKASSFLKRPKETIRKIVKGQDRSRHLVANFIGGGLSQ